MREYTVYRLMLAEKIWEARRSYRMPVPPREDDFLEFWEKKINNESAKIACLEAASFENSISSYTTP